MLRLRLFSRPAESGGYAVIARLAESAFGKPVSGKRVAICAGIITIASCTCTYLLLRSLRASALQAQTDARLADVTTRLAEIDSVQNSNRILLDSINSALNEALSSYSNSESTNSTPMARGMRISPLS